jgi:hypothetical protein
VSDVPEARGETLDGHPAPAPPWRGRSLVRVVLEVALIATGVFLGLMGEQWRERAQHRELAVASLRRFRSEFQANRDAVAAVREHHVAGLGRIQEYFRADPETRARLGNPFRGTHPAFFEYSAWDVALATQSLAYIESDLAHAVSHVYSVQRQLDGATRDITHIMYAKNGEENLPSFLGSMASYFGDCNLIEPRLLELYDEILPRIDRALGRAPAAAPARGAARDGR